MSIHENDRVGAEGLQDPNDEKLVDVQDVLLSVCRFLGPGAELILASRFTDLYGGQPAQDRVRGQRISPGVTLDTLGEQSGSAP